MKLIRNVAFGLACALIAGLIITHELRTMIEGAVAQVYQNLVTQGPTRLDASTFIYGEGGAGGPGVVTGCNAASGTVAQTTVTIPGQAGYYIYISGYFGHLAEINATGTGVAALTVSTTNLTGGPFWDYGSVTNTTGADQQYFAEMFPTGLKSAQPGVAVTFVPSGALDANHILCQRVSGWYATQ